MSLTSRIARAATATAVAGAALLALSGTASASQSAPYIGDGYANNSQAVWCVQHNINHFIDITTKTDRPARLDEDGLWGPKTKAAVQWIQEDAYVGGQKLQTDGIVGPLTGDMIVGEGYPDSVGTYNSPCWAYIPTNYGP
ncbi:peptidoglycan-binding domain-containing protein [Kitasatospora sp. NPDC089797]|uniref:peptidoglycan-binding domain-containing protein n=1 Tax=Kitasatospora sp. NPDC089797 TaxID=3155298 RepID=UPI003422C4AB